MMNDGPGERRPGPRLGTARNTVFRIIKMPISDRLEQFRGTETILIVDDHETIWDFLIEALQALGYSVLLAENGKEAVDIYKGNPGAIDLVLLDMVMPVMNAHEAFPLLKEADPNVRVLLASGYVEEEDVQDLLSNGAISFMRKPYLLKDLARRIRDILDKTEHDHDKA